jgi:glutathione S-transferase
LLDQLLKGNVMAENLILHEYAPSGNCYKIRLTAALLGIPIERRHYDILKGETRTPQFLGTVSANGRTPVLQIGDRFLAESNAACVWLAQDSVLIPTDRFDHADMLHWMFWEQYNHEPNIATLRFWLAFVGETNLTDIQRAQIAGKKDAGNAALKLMDNQLAKQQWLVGGQASLADVALFAYTHVAEEGGAFALADYPNVGRWIDAIKALPGYIAITD